MIQDFPVQITMPTLNIFNLKPIINIELQVIIFDLKMMNINLCTSFHYSTTIFINDMQ